MTNTVLSLCLFRTIQSATFQGGGSREAEKLPTTELSSSDESVISEEETVKVYPIKNKKRPAEKLTPATNTQSKVSRESLPPPSKKQKASKFSFRVW